MALTSGIRLGVYFYRQPAWMRQWPYAHTVEITYRLAGGVLEVDTAIANLSNDPMPVAVGFHPYFQLTDSPRDQWRLSVAATTRWRLDARKLPTGETEPAAALLLPPSVSLRDYNLDDRGRYGDAQTIAPPASTSPARSSTTWRCTPRRVPCVPNLTAYRR